METTGHSIANPRVLAEAGIEAIFVLNIEPDDRKLRLEDRALEFIWRPMFDHLGRRAEIFGHVFYDFHTSPLEILQDDRINYFDPTDNHTKPNGTDPVGPPPGPHGKPDLKAAESSTNSNSSRLRDYILEMSEYFRTKHLLLMIGANENFEKAEHYYQEL